MQNKLAVIYFIQRNAKKQRMFSPAPITVGKYHNPRRQSERLIEKNKKAVSQRLFREN